MYLPPLQPVTNTEIRICGDVEIHPSASIAPGVVLQATSNSRIIIGVDVCLGMGVIINAHNGDVEISDGATLGSGVLIVGFGHIGKNACLGTSTTIFNSSVEAMKVIPPGSIIGCNPNSFNKASPLTEKKTAAPQNNLVQESPTKGTKEVNQDISANVLGNYQDKLRKNNGSFSDSKQATAPQVVNNISGSDPWQEEEIKEIKLDKTKSEKTKEEDNKSITIGTNITIGKGYIEDLIGTLFPHKKNS